MPDNLNMDELNEARRQSVAETIHPISLEELKSLADALFPQVDHPWREKLLGFLAANAGATFHHATTHDRIHIIYCGAKNKGIWFTPGSGVGPLQEKGLKALEQIVSGI